MIVWKQLTGPGWRRNPASWEEFKNANSLPPIGGFSMMDLKDELSVLPGESICPGNPGKNDDRESLNFLPLNLLYECSKL